MLFLLKRLATGLILAMLVTFFTFLLLSPSFESIVRTMLGTVATPEAIAAKQAQLGIDRPVIVQYVDWLLSAFRGDFGRSFFTSEPVGGAVLTRLSVTLSLVVVSLLVTVVVSVALGVMAAVRGGVIDRVAQGISLVGYIVPGLLLAIGLVAVFAINLRLLPATGYVPFEVNPLQWLSTILLPVIVLVIGGTAALTAQVRGSMIDELRKDYVRTLRTRGMSWGSIVLGHALRNAAGPALTVLSLQFIQMFGGALIIENVFALPGFGSFAFGASLQGDVPVIMGVTVFSVLLVLSVNLVVDVANGWLNPKVRIA